MQKFADEEIFRRLRDEITSGEKLGFKVKYDGEDLVLEKEKGLLFSDCFWIKRLSVVSYNIMLDWKGSANMMC